MKTLIAFFFRYLLLPILVIIMLFVINSVGKIKKQLRLKRVIVFVLLTSLIFITPSLFGLLRNEFVWGGLILTILSYLFLGVLLFQFSKTKLFKSLGTNGKKPLELLIFLIVALLSMWIYFLIFERISKLPYAAWAMTNVFWFFVPVLFGYSREYFLKISPAFYNTWEIDNKTINREYWETIDTFKLMQVVVKIKRKPQDSDYTSLSVKLPAKVSLGMWFNRLVEDQNIRFPQNTIEKEIDGESIGWIFYTGKWFNLPLFVRVLDPNKDSEENNIRKNQVIYVRRTRLKENITNSNE